MHPDLLPTSVCLRHLASAAPDLTGFGLVLTPERLVTVWAANKAADEASKLRVRRFQLTPRQRQILCAWEQTDGTRKATAIVARRLGITGTYVRYVLGRLRRKGLVR
jgi:DNA-binding CsgD family transcriptional regulator